MVGRGGYGTMVYAIELAMVRRVCRAGAKQCCCRSMVWYNTAFRFGAVVDEGQAIKVRSLCAQKNSSGVL